MYFNLQGIENEIYMSLRSFWLINALKRKESTKLNKYETVLLCIGLKRKIRDFFFSSTKEVI